MVLKNYKKTLAVIGIIAILFPVFFLAGPQKAKAIVPVFDAAVAASTAATAVSTGIIAKSYVAKEYVLDTIAYAVAKIALKALTQSIVTWIRSGFQGNPLFITDLQGHLTDAADQATGQFMKEFLSPEVYNAICSPFRLQLRLALSGGYTYADRMRCTLSTVMGNVASAADFGRNLTEGGWRQWAAISLSPQNEPHGALLTSLDELLGRQAAAQNTAKTESIFNQGFLSMKKCVEYYADEWTGGQMCVRYENTSPGKWVSDTLSQATGIDFQSLAFADELNEIIVALISQLLTGILQR